MKLFLIILPALLGFAMAGSTGSAKDCPAAQKIGSGPPENCQLPSDPKNLTKSKLEDWFTKEMFADLFPHANIGWGPHACYPYSYESFVIAARYFPAFGTSSPNRAYSPEQNYRRDVAAFFAHAIQETGENNYGYYQGGSGMTTEEARNCFYRGGFYNWFEGGPTSAFLPAANPGHQPSDGDRCNVAGVYCTEDPTIKFFYPCSRAKKGSYSAGCYFGRGAIQLSYNYNYGAFQKWLEQQGIHLNLLENPNLVLTHMNPPLAIMASLWFYMTPQPPKPAMHDIVMGQWNAGEQNEKAGYSGPIFGPTSLVINNECGGESAVEPGTGGENRRIRAFKWFCDYFDVPAGADRLLSCKHMPFKFDRMQYPLSYQPNWLTTWKEVPCDCAPATYGGLIPYFDPKHYPENWVEKNAFYREQCVKSIYENPGMYYMAHTSRCLNYPSVQ
uniref:Glyco_hydro_19_cat domain-containing protein n=1 Tax=Steinernema glaseri TaxID=37863 RepID=A0A1I7ZI45_9BILA